MANSKKHTLLSRKHKKKSHFKKNHEFKGNQYIWPLRAKKRIKYTHNTFKKVRLTQLDFDRLLTKDKKGIAYKLRNKTDQESTINIMMLRPKKIEESISQSYAANNRDLGNDEMRLLNQQAVNEMWNKATTEHQDAGRCKKVDLFVQQEEKYGLCWQQRLGCSNCRYISAKHKLYREVSTNKRFVRTIHMNKEFI